MKILFIFTSILTIAVLAQSEWQRQSISKHVIHGKMATFRKFPWQAHLIVFRKSSSSICGGSLISDRWILTAAHCMKNTASVTVRLGTVHRDIALVSMKSKQFVIHQKFQGKNNNNDIALLKLPASVNLTTLNPYVKVINLPTRSMAKKSFVGTEATVSGFGDYDDSHDDSNNLRYAKLKIISNEECSFYYEPDSIISSTICAMGSDDITQISCDGDSGGPLVTEVNGTSYIIGSVAFGSKKGCQEGYPDCFTRTSSYLDWISEVTGIQIRI